MAADDVIDAPIACIDEWSDEEIKAVEVTKKIIDEVNQEAKLNGSALSHESSGSLEDLVASFDEQIVRCLRTSDSVEQIAPVQTKSMDELINESQEVWWNVYASKKRPMEFNYATSQIKANLDEAVKHEIQNRASSSSSSTSTIDVDEDLVAAFDMNSMVISSIYNDNWIESADDVIAEIEEIMNQADLEASMFTCTTDSGYNQSLTSSFMSTAVAANQLQFRHCVADMPSMQDLLKMNESELNSHMEELEQCAKYNNEVLLELFDQRDELQYEKELRNQFISVLMEAQKKRAELLKSPNEADKSHCLLSIHIPFDPSVCSNTDGLRTLISIMKALLRNDKSVPSMLTNYILKVYCPSENANTPILNIT